MEFEDLNKEAEEIHEPEKAAEIMKRHEDIIKTKRRGLWTSHFTFHQRMVVKQTYKQKYESLHMHSFHLNMILVCENKF